MMLPITLDLSRVPVALIGRGERAVRRLSLIEADGVPRVRVFSDRPSAALANAARTRLVARLPTASDLAGSKIVFVADLAPEEVDDVVRAAAIAGALVNVEDQRGWCDFHSSAVLRRGDLTVAISTDGKSPTLARRLRAHLSKMLPPDWANHAERLSALRRRLRVDGAVAAEVAAASDAMIDAANWLARSRPTRQDAPAAAGRAA